MSNEVHLPQILEVTKDKDSRVIFNKTTKVFLFPPEKSPYSLSQTDSPPYIGFNRNLLINKPLLSPYLQYCIDTSQELLKRDQRFPTSRDKKSKRHIIDLYSSISSKAKSGQSFDGLIIPPPVVSKFIYHSVNNLNYANFIFEKKKKTDFAH
jgi:hypothetical protein